MKMMKSNAVTVICSSYLFKALVLSILSLSTVYNVQLYSKQEKDYNNF